MSKLLTVLFVVSMGLGLVSSSTGCGSLMAGAHAVTAPVDPTRPPSPENPSALTAAAQEALKASQALAAARTNPTPENQSNAIYGIGGALAALVAAGATFLKGMADKKVAAAALAREASVANARIDKTKAEVDGNWDALAKAGLIKA